MKFTYPPGATPIDPDEAAGLIPSHITLQRELNEWEEANILEGARWARSRRVREVLSLDFIARLHRRMFDRTWTWAGQFRSSLKNLGVAPVRIREDLLNLCEDAKLWRSDRLYPPIEIGVRFHHRLVSIHPFANGNGRHARLMTDLLLESMGAKPLSWGRAKLAARGQARARYIAALQSADRGDLKPLLIFAQS